MIYLIVSEIVSKEKKFWLKEFLRQKGLADSVSYYELAAVLQPSISPF